MAMLADEILAARGAPEDWGGIITNVAKVVEKAQRFELGDRGDRGSAEPRHEPSEFTGRDAEILSPAVCKHVARMEGKRRPKRLPAGNRPRNRASVRGRHMGIRTRRTRQKKRRGQSNGSLFDWSDSFTMPEQMRSYFRSMGNDSYTSLSRDDAADMMRNNPQVKQAWGRYSSNEAEIEALVKLDTSVSVFPSGHAITMLRQLDERVSKTEQQQFLQQCYEYLTGEPPITRAVVTLLNCKNGLAREPMARSDKVNKHRIKAGKPPLLDYVTTRLTLSPRSSVMPTRKGSITPPRGSIWYAGT